MIEQPLLRVRYYPGQCLRPRDFVDEQTYHLRQHGFHLLKHHTPGILKDLQVAFVEEEGRFVVRRGVAVAKDGTVILLSDQHPIDVNRFDEKGVDRLAVYLDYEPTPKQTLPPGYSRCGVPEGENSNRAGHQAVINVDSYDRSEFERSDRRSVFLGRLIRDFAQPPDKRYHVDPTQREYVGAYAALIDAPSGAARVEIGPENAPSDARNFAVLLPKDDPANTAQSSSPCERNIEFTPVIEINNRQFLVDGDTTVTGDVRVEKGAVCLGEPSPIPKGSKEDKKDRPWHLYRYCQSNPDQHEMRIELPHVETQEAAIVIGSFPAGGDAFVPLLTVSNFNPRAGNDGDKLRGHVTVHCDLDVEGAICAQQREEAELSPEAKQLIYSGVLLDTDDAQKLIAAFQATKITPTSDFIIDMFENEKKRTIVVDIVTALNSALFRSLVNELITESARESSKMQIIVESVIRHDQGIGQLVKSLEAAPDRLRVVIREFSDKFPETDPPKVAALAREIADVDPRWAATLKDHLPDHPTPP